MLIGEVNILYENSLVKNLEENINDFLEGCTPNGNSDCIVPFFIYSGTQSSLELHDLRIFYERLGIIGDVNGDCKVGIVDLATVGKYYGTSPSDLNWNPGADVYIDGKIDIKDLTAVGMHYGQTC